MTQNYHRRYVPQIITELVFFSFKKLQASTMYCLLSLQRQSFCNIKFDICRMIVATNNALIIHNTLLDSFCNVLQQFKAISHYFQRLFCNKLTDSLEYI